MGDPPSPPSPEGSADDQFIYNVLNQKLGFALNMDETDPYGNTVTYHRAHNDNGKGRSIKITMPDGSVVKAPMFEKTVEFSPAMKELMEKQQTMQSGMLDLMNTGIKNVSELFNDPISFEGIDRPLTPDLIQNYGDYVLKNEYDRVDLLQQIDPTHTPITSTIGDAGNIVDTIDPYTGNVVTSLRPTTGSIISGVDGAGGQNLTFGNTSTGIQTGVEGAGGQDTLFGNTDQDVLYGINGELPSWIYQPEGTEDVQFGYGDDDFEQSRGRVEASLMSRIDPYFERRQSSADARAAARGLAPGSEAYEEEMGQIGRDWNDASMQAVQAGGAEQSRLWAEARAKAQFHNQAVAQDYAQKMGEANFSNATRVQAFTENMLRTQQWNEAQAQQFSQLYARGTFKNAAQAANFAQVLQAANFANEAQAQEFAQLMNRGVFTNNAQAANFAQIISAANFANSAQAQEFNQIMQSGQFTNAAVAQQFAQQMEANKFLNAAQAQRFAQMLQEGQFQNAAQAQEWMQNEAQANFINNVRTQEERNNLMAATFFNQTQMTQEQQDRLRAEFQNAVATQGYGFAVDQYNRQVQEMLTKRQSGLGELMQLLGFAGGAGPTAPDFPNPTGAGPATAPDLMEMLMNNFNTESQNWQTQQNNMWGFGNALVGALPFG